MHAQHSAKKAGDSGINTAFSPRQVSSLRERKQNSHTKAYEPGEMCFSCLLTSSQIPNKFILSFQLPVLGQFGSGAEN